MTLPIAPVLNDGDKMWRIFDKDSLSISANETEAWPCSPAGRSRSAPPSVASSASTNTAEIVPSCGRKRPLGSKGDETEPIRKRRSSSETEHAIPDDSTNEASSFTPKGKTESFAPATILRQWFLDHIENPYPKQEQKDELCYVTGMTSVQLRNWFTNMRKRHWNPVRAGREPRSYIDYLVFKRLRDVQGV